MHSLTKVWLSVIALSLLVACGGGSDTPVNSPVVSSPPPPLPPPPPPPPVVVAPIDAGIFKQPSTYIEAADPSAKAVELTQLMRSLTAPTDSVLNNIPFYDAVNKHLVLPNVNVNGEMYDETVLRLTDSGTFTLLTSPRTGSAEISAANYEEGNLVLTSVSINGERFTNMKLHLNRKGEFEVVNAFSPIIVKASSYHNAKDTGLEPKFLPVITSTYNSGQIHNARAFADFEQTGRYSYFVSVYDYTNEDPFHDGPLVFYRLNDDETFEDITAEMLMVDPVTGERPMGCNHPRKSIVADFNGDQMPDVFVACLGTEAPSIDTTEKGRTQEYDQIILSQPNGKYKVRSLTEFRKGATETAAAYDFSGKGFASVINTDFNSSRFLEKDPTIVSAYVLRNTEDGEANFVEDRTAFRDIIHPFDNIYTVEVVEYNGKPTLWMAHTVAFAKDFENDELMPTALYEIFVNGSDFSFNPEPIVTMPNPIAGDWYLDCVRNCYNVVLDVVFADNTAYILRVESVYSTYMFQKVNLTTMLTESEWINQDTEDFSTKALKVDPVRCVGFGGTWLDYIRVRDDKIISDFKCISPNLGVDF